MGIGAYLCTNGILILICLLIFARLRRRVFSYGLVSLAVAIAILIAFGLLSSASGVIQFGRPMTLNVPQDYLARGPLGWGILAISFLGLIAPILVAIPFLRRYNFE